MNKTRLSPEAVRRNAQKLKDELGRADRERLDALLGLLQSDGRINLGNVLKALYPEQKTDAAMMAFRQYRKRLGEIANNAAIRFSMEADSRKKTPPEERWCWFSGEHGAAEAITRIVREETEFVQRTCQGAFELRDGKPVIRYFISYAHEDAPRKDDLCKRLAKLFKIDSAYHYEEWHDRLLLPGDKWREEILSAIERCHFGLLLVTPSFLGSEFITREELPAFVPRDLCEPEAGKRAIPVALDRILFDGSVDLKGLQHIQIFHDSDGKPFSERTGIRKDEFARQLFLQIRRVLGDRIFPEFAIKFNRHRLIEQHVRREIDGAFDGCNFVPTEAFCSTLDKLDAGSQGEAAPKQRIDAIGFLMDWVKTPDSPPYFALLGELGMGKTTTCLAFARELLDLRGNDSTLPLPIYMDLRLLGEKAATEASLEEILNTVMGKKWHGGRVRVEVSAEDVIRLVQEEGALAIFDGLDEVLVHLTTSGEQRFLRELLRLLPPLLVKGKNSKESVDKKIGRLLLSCRTHYFPTLRAQKNLLLGEDREPLSANDYRALVLMPFSEEQIIGYLRKILPDQEPERVLDTIRSVHNLTEMAERPYTLSLIAREIPQIEQWKIEGRRVTGVTLYRHMVHSWLERDAGKHTLTLTHKQRLMELFAAELWRSGRRAWSVEDLEQWLIDFLRGHPEIAAHYEGKDRELLKEDLRTATFLVREGEDQFRFAHTSLLEFFLACHLHRGLLENDFERWSIPMVSRETCDFLGQLLTEDEGSRNKSMANLKALLREGYRSKGSEQALAYALLAHEKGLPAPVLANIRMEGADLREWKFHGKPNAKLNLRGSNWRGARLAGASFLNADLECADFSEAYLDRGEFIGCRLNSAPFTGAHLSGTIFRETQLKDVDFSGGHFHRTKWLKCGVKEARNIPSLAPDSFFALCDQKPQTYPPMAKTTLNIVIGHSFAHGASFSPDGRRIASVGDNGSVLIWDTESGEQLAELSDHMGLILGVAWAGDGRRIASVGRDGNLRLWDADKYRQLAELHGHEGWIRGIAWASDGRCLASVGDDGTVRIWDADTNKQLIKLHGHKGPVLSIAWDADCRRLASGGEAGTVIIWDADTGAQLAELRGHGGPVNGVAWAVDGRRLATAGDDVRIWDTETGKKLDEYHGHAGGWVNGIAWSADGWRLASAGDDGTVRIWDTNSGEQLAELHKHRGSVFGVAWAADGRRLASAGSDGCLIIWDIDTGEQFVELRGHQGWINGIAWAADGRRLASPSGDGSVRIWDADTGCQLIELRGHEYSVWDVAWDENGRRLASAGLDGSVRIWDTDTGCQLVETRGDRAVWGVAWAPDGQRFVSAGSGGYVRIWDANTGEQLAELSGGENSIKVVAWTSDGLRIATAGFDGSVSIWDSLTYAQVAELRGHQELVLSVAWAVDCQRLASAGVDGTVLIWDADTGEQLAKLLGHKGWVNGVTWAADSRRLASAGDDGSVRIWDVISGEQIAELCGHRGMVKGVAWAPDGLRLAFACGDGTVHIWDQESEKEILQISLFEVGAWAVIDPVNNRIKNVSGEAWRWLGWSGIDPASGRMERWPAEIFGPLPEWKPKK